MNRNQLAGAGFSGVQVDALMGSITTKTPAGSAIGNATALGDASVVILADAATTAGVQLPSAGAGTDILLFNAGLNSTNVYPPAGGAISNGTVNASVVLPAKVGATFRGADVLNYSVDTALPLTASNVTPAGTVIGNATAISVGFAVLVDAAVSTGAQLPSGQVGKETVVFNNGGNTALIYPPTNGTINNGSANAAIEIRPGDTLVFRPVTSTAYATKVAEISTRANITPAGTVIGNATAITSAHTVFDDAAANTGAQLPSGQLGKLFVMHNNSGNITKLYPPTNGTLNGGSANASISLASKASALAIPSAAANFTVIT